MSSSRAFLASLVLLLVTGAYCNWCGPLVRYQKPTCSIIGSSGGYQLREYPGNQFYVQAELSNITFETAWYQGFRMLAAYIHGESWEGTVLEETVPFFVRMLPGNTTYIVGRFLDLRGQKAPTPLNPLLRVTQLPGCFKVASTSFTGSGLNRAQMMYEMAQLLKAVSRTPYLVAVDNTQTFYTYNLYSTLLEVQAEVEFQALS